MKNNDYIQKVWLEVQAQRDAEEAKKNRVRGPRDTQFIDSAQRVVASLPEFPSWIGYSVPEWREEVTEIIAQYAYDIVSRAIAHIEHIDLDRLSIEEHICRIPDLENEKQ